MFFSFFIAFITEAISSINEEAPGAINEAAIGAIIATRSSPSSLFILCFTVSVAPLTNRPNFSSDSTILTISPYLHSKINKVNPFPALTTLSLFTFISNLPNIDEVALVANLGKTSIWVYEVYKCFFA